MKVIVCCLTYRHNNTKFSLIYKKGILKDAFLLFCIWYREPDLVKPARPRNFHTISIANNLKNFLADCHVLLLKIEYIWWARGDLVTQARPRKFTIANIVCIGMFPCGLPLAILTPTSLRTPDFERSAPKRRALAKNSNSLVGRGGLEPPRPYEHQILSLTRLPFRHPPNKLYKFLLNY